MPQNGKQAPFFPVFVASLQIAELPETVSNCRSLVGLQLAQNMLQVADPVTGPGFPQRLFWFLDMWETLLGVHRALVHDLSDCDLY